MGDWGSLRVSWGVSAFDADLAVACLGFLEKSKIRPYRVRLSEFPTFSEHLESEEQKNKVSRRYRVKFSDFSEHFELNDFFWKKKFILGDRSLFDV